jgi:hypothetical protein
MKNLVLVAAAAVTIIGFGTTPSSANGTTWYIDPEIGTDSSTCGGPSVPGSEPAFNQNGGGQPSTGPCATLNQALQNGSAGDNFFIEKSGIFGPIVVTSNIAINGPEDRSAVISWYAGTLPGCLGGAPGTCNGNSSATYGIDVNPSASSNAVIRLKNILISGGAGANAALHIGNAFNTTLSKVTVRGPNVSTAHILMNPSSLGSNGQAQLYMKDCDVGFTSGGGGNIHVVPSGATPTYVHIIGSEFHNATFGAKFDAASMSSDALNVEVEGSEFFAFNGSGVAVVGTGSGFSHVAFSRSSVLDSGQQAVQVNGANAGLVLYEDVILGNNIGVNVVNGGGAGSAGNNLIYGNGNNEANCDLNGTPSSSCSGVLGNVGQQ